MKTLNLDKGQGMLAQHPPPDYRVEAMFFHCHKAQSKDV